MIDALATRVTEGDPRAMARAMSLVEDDGAAGQDVVRALVPHTGRAFVVGITGAPGAGKSTLVDRLITAWRARGQTVGVVAVDPSSPFSGGAILGDRVRMTAHAHDTGVFVRSMATRGHLGGLARATSDVALVLDASGRDVVVIETVGVGQDEVDIVRTADVSVVVLVPGLGDDVQAIKAGVMEIADVFAVNKADREGADRVVASVEAMQALRPTDAGAWTPPIVPVQAINGTGIDALMAAIDACHAQRVSAPDRRRARAEYRLREVLSHRFLQHVERQVLAPGEMAQWLDALAARTTDVYSVADRILGRACRPEQKDTAS